MIESTTSIPLGALIAMCWNSTCILEHSRKVEQIPGHECGVAIGKIILGPSRSGIQIGGSRSCRSQPVGIRLRRDDVAEMLEGIENIHRAVLGSVLVARNQTASDTTVEDVLAVFMQIPGIGIESLKCFSTHPCILTHPQR